jgi:hypothetical protein
MIRVPFLTELLLDVFFHFTKSLIKIGQETFLKSQTKKVKNLNRMKYIFVFLVLYSCNTKPDRNADENEYTSSLDSKISEKEAGICEICPKDAFMVETLDSNQNVPLTFNKPIVLEFFNLYDAIEKYDTEFKQDSLPEKLKKDPYRQEIYRTIDQVGYYGHLRKELESLDVTILRSQLTDDFVRFVEKDKSYLVDLRAYRETDGVLMFNPGKKPIFWTSSEAILKCKDMEGIGRWYFNCP